MPISCVVATDTGLFGAGCAGFRAVPLAFATRPSIVGASKPAQRVVADGHDQGLTEPRGHVIEDIGDGESVKRLATEKRIVMWRRSGLCSDPEKRGSYSAARALRIPSFSMRTCNVLRFNPSSTAAPFGPPTTQSVA